MKTRVPLSIVSSLVFHAALLGLFVPIGNRSEDKETFRADVDLIVRVRKPVPVKRVRPAGVKPTTPPTIKDFLKMALPSRRRPAAPKPLVMKVPTVTRRTARRLDIPKSLQDRGRRKTASKMQALNLDRKRTKAAGIGALPTMKRRSSAMAVMPRLEEIGRRKVRNLPQAIALEEKRREAVAIKNLEALTPKRRRRAPEARAVLREATPIERKRLGSRLDAFLPVRQQISLQPLTTAPKPVKKIKRAAPVRKRKVAALELDRPKKSVEIEGQLADRDIVYYELPEFPEWARNDGIDHAEVSIRFYVDRAGKVLPGMRVEMTSGFGRLDRLVMASLKNWKFAPGALQDRQWGIITFRFVLD